MVSVDDVADKWLDNTQNSDNYQKWERNTQASVNGETTTAGEGLAQKIDELSASDVDDYNDKWSRETQRAINDDAYQGTVQNLDESDWRNSFMQAFQG